MDYELKPGQIILFKKKKGFDPIGSFITSEERDTDVCHVAFIGINGDIWSTGVMSKLGMPFYYGRINATQYCTNRDFYVCEFDHLSPLQLSIMDTNAKRMQGMMYGFWKVMLLIQRSRLGGIVNRLYPWLTKTVRDPFCSEAVADCCWRAGLHICESLGKEEPSAITPANIKSYAQLKGTSLNIVKEVNQ